MVHSIWRISQLVNLVMSDHKHISQDAGSGEEDRGEGDVERGEKDRGRRRGEEGRGGILREKRIGGEGGHAWQQALGQ